MDINSALNFENARAWSAWLEQNHDLATEAWLVIYKKGSSLPGLRYDEALEVALRFGWIDGKMKSVDADTFILRYSPRKTGSVWSKANREKAERLIAEGRMTEAGLARVEEARKNGLWNAAYTNKKRDRLPADLKVALLKDRDAWLNFQKFANSYRNMYIGWVTGAKTPATRGKRIAEVVRRSALNRKPGIE